MQAYPLMVRKRIIELSQQQVPTKQIAELFGVCRSGVRRIQQRFCELKTLEPKRGTPGRKPQLTPQLQQRLREHVAARPDATRQEIKDALRLEVSLQTVGEWLAKLELPLKKSRFTPPSRTAPTSKRPATPGTNGRRACRRTRSSVSTSRAPRPT